ncbi:MAG: response regulator [Terriglobia bacterium]
MPGKILLADDSLKIQKDVTQLLKGAGIEVVTVSNGEHAVRKLADVKPDLVLADLFMPVRSGFEVCEYIKNNEEFSHLPVLVLASSMEPYDEKEAQRVGVDAHLTKPFSDPAAALATIKQWLEKAAQTKPAEPAPPIEEFAAAVPAAEAEPEPEPEPAYEEFSTHPPPVTFDQQEAPMGFTDVVEEAPTAPAEPPPPEAPAAPAETPAPAAGAVTSEPVEEEVAAEEVRAPGPESPPGKPFGVEAPPTAMVPEAEPEPEAAEAPPAPVQWPTEPAAEAAPPPAETPPAPAAGEAPPQPEYRIEKPELASPWEMTGPPPGAPEIPSGAGWDSQWKGTAEAEAPEAPGPPAEAAEATPPETAAPPEAAEAPVPEAPAPEPVEAPPAEEAAAERFEPAEFAAAMAAAEEAAPATPQSGVDPAVIDAVVKEVVERLSPQVVEQITREIVRPLAEALLKQKLNQQ